MCYSVLVERDLEKLQLDFDASPDETSFELLESLSRTQPKRYKTTPENARIYPNYFAPVIVADNTLDGIQRKLRPMRYRMRPAGSREEVPTRYNMFNARLDSLTVRRSWSQLFGRRHGLLIAKGFYEWVERDGKKQVIIFRPRNLAYMVIPVLYDEWHSDDGKESFASFALITGEPNPEIEAAGHDRCPIFLQEQYREAWLAPEKIPRSKLLAMLGDPAEVYYEHENAQP